MSDLVERLHKVDDWPREICREAADEIERLHDLHLERTKLTSKMIAERDDARVQAERLRAALEELREKYEELLYQVASKYPGESRHDTAKRYIHERETRPLQTASADTALNPDD